MKHLAIITAIVFLLMSCKDEDSNPTNGGLAGIENVVNGSEGSNIDITLPDGSKEASGESKIFDWASGI